MLTEDYQKEMKKSEISNESIEQAITTLKNEDDYENCLLLLLISKYYLLPDALVLIRFEDFGTSKDGKRFMNIFSKTRRRYDVIYIFTKKLLKLWVNWRDQGLFAINDNMRQKEVEEKTSR